MSGQHRRASELILQSRAVEARTGEVCSSPRLLAWAEEQLPTRPCAANRVQTSQSRWVAPPGYRVGGPAREAFRCTSPSGSAPTAGPR